METKDASAATSLAVEVVQKCNDAPLDEDAQKRVAEACSCEYLSTALGEFFYVKQSSHLHGVPSTMTGYSRYERVGVRLAPCANNGVRNGRLTPAQARI